MIEKLKWVRRLLHTKSYIIVVDGGGTCSIPISVDVMTEEDAAVLLAQSAILTDIMDELVKVAEAHKKRLQELTNGKASDTQTTWKTHIAKTVHKDK